MKKNNKQLTPKILLFDIETLPIEAYVWGLWDNNVALNQIKQDWTVLSWSAKWLEDSPKKMMYADVRKEKNVRNDKNILLKMWKLLDEAEVVITQNGVKFDSKKLNARFAIHDIPPPSPYKHIDTLKIAKNHFAFTSNKLEYMAQALGVKYKKLKPKKFPGFEMWSACLNKNIEAFNEMQRYNNYDVLALQCVYERLIVWDNTINFNVFNPEVKVCSCGSKEFKENGYDYQKLGKFKRYKCKKCGKHYRDGVNLLKEAKKMLR